MKFDGIGKIIGYRVKLIKHMNDTKDPHRVKDYLTVGYDDIDPSSPESHPCWEDIKGASEWLKERGWKVMLYDWGTEKGVQFTCISPDNKWYRSHYDHNKKNPS